MKKNIFIFCIYLLAIGFTRANSMDWPVLKHYDQDHLYKIALPIGGIGTGSVSLGGIGNLQDWEIMNRPAIGYNPSTGMKNSPFFVLYTDIHGVKDIRLLEGPVPFYLYEGESGSIATNHGLPRFRTASFDAAYPFGQVNLSTPESPVKVKIKAFNPMIPGDVDNSSIPIAVLDYELTNTSDNEIIFSVCGTMPNFIGEDGSNGKAVGNKNTFMKGSGFKGILFTSDGVDKKADQWGEMALVTPSDGETTYRTAWKPEHWGSSLLDFWDDLSADGLLENRKDEVSQKPVASLAVGDTLKPHETKTVRFLLTWYFPNRTAWSSEPMLNYYTTKYQGAWDVVVKTVPELSPLEENTVKFVTAFCESDLPEVAKEAALFNASTLRTQTCFRLNDGNLYAWEGCLDHVGCCFGSCTHVWNYETATSFLFGDLAKTWRYIEFGPAAQEDGLMSFRVKLPLNEIPKFSYAAADGQMGTIMKFYLDWQLSGDDEFLKTYYPKIKSTISYAWIKGGWDANQDGVMEGVQSNTMDVEYYGPNPQEGTWYLGALNAVEEMAVKMNDRDMAMKCRKLFSSGSKWMDANLFNGEYYIQKIMVSDSAEIPKGQIVGMGAKNNSNPDYQLGDGCLVDQLVGQYMAHVCGLGYLLKEENVKTALQSIMKYNYKSNLYDHFNCMRSFALGDEAALLMASYPKSRPVNPFPYFTEVMTGFEYTAAIGMLYEDQTDNGLKCIQNIRDRYDGRKRSPFDEAECGHHYGRAMDSWSAILALTGFHYSGVTDELSFKNIKGKYFWSNGYAYGTMEFTDTQDGKKAVLTVLNGKLKLRQLNIEGLGSSALKKTMTFQAGDHYDFLIKG